MAQGGLTLAIAMLRDGDVSSLPAARHPTSSPE